MTPWVVALIVVGWLALSAPALVTMWDILVSALDETLVGSLVACFLIILVAPIYGLVLWAAIVFGRRKLMGN